MTLTLAGFCAGPSSSDENGIWRCWFLWREDWKTKELREKTFAARREQATHIHLFCTGLESNLSHIGGR